MHECSRYAESVLGVEVEEWAGGGDGSPWGKVAGRWLEFTIPDLPATEAGRCQRFGHGVESDFPGAGTRGGGLEDESIDPASGRVLLRLDQDPTTLRCALIKVL
jgi:hypothetical protein